MIARRRKEGSNSKNGANKQQKENPNTNNQKSSSKKEKFYNGESKQHKPHKFRKDFGFTLQDIKSWENFVKFMYKPMDPASLGLIRIMFGFLMVFDIPEERGLANADIYWGDPTECRFPLFNFLKPLQLQWMCIVYFIMWLGALGIMLGFHFHKSCLLFSATYWYIFLLDKTSWNNHSYMYGVISILLLGSQANNFWSLDILLGRVQSNCPVPLWNYFILRFQIFILYFYAGLKKMDSDWLQGYSMRNLSNHWVFEPFRMVLTPEQVDYWLIHVTGFMLDLSIGFFLMINKTRPFGLFFLGMFHVMNSQLFSIGMFPYVCLATMPIFCDANWPRKLLKVFVSTNSTGTRSDKHKENSPDDSKTGLKSRKSQESLYNESIGWKHKLIVGLLISHIGVQAFLPYSHFITKGYNNWTYGLYGYSWDMMVHTWDTVLVVVKVVDNESGKEHFLDPEAWVQSNRWEKHGDMLIQYAHCLKGKLLTGVSDDGDKTHQYTLSNNISIYLDVWCSLNGRFQQRMFNPRVDLLTVEWSPFKEVSFLMPLLTEFSDWRDQIVKLEKEVYSWSQWSDVLFVADFPGLSLENYINEDLSNVTLSLLEGEVVVETEILQKETEENKKKRREAVGLTRRRLEKQESIKLPAGRFHRVVTVSKTPACYMYTYTNKTKQIEDEEITKGNQTEQEITSIGTPFVDKFIERASRKVRNFLRAIGLVSNAILNVLYSVPMVKRVRVA